jgi:hypothetical protein
VENGAWKINEKAGQSLADPVQYENLFPKFQDSLKVEQYLAHHESTLLPATDFTRIPLNIERDALEEMNKNELEGNFQYSKTDKPQIGDASMSELVEKVKLDIDSTNITKTTAST